MKNVVIFGATGHSKVVADAIIKLNQYNLIGFIDLEENIGKTILSFLNKPLKIIGSENNLSILIEKYNIYGGIVGIGDNKIRKKISDNIIEQHRNFKFINVLHPTASLALDIKLGSNNFFAAGAVVSSGTIIGNGCIINTLASVDHDNIVSDYVHLAPHARTGGFTMIHELSNIFMGANIASSSTNHIQIGKNVTVGANSVVLKNIADNCTVYGVPAIIKKKMEN